MAENSPPGPEDGREPFPDLISLPHAHPATSFSNHSQADLDRMAMPPPPPPQSASAAPALDATTPVLEPRALHSFSLREAAPHERVAWLESSAADFNALRNRISIIARSEALARGLDEEIRVIDRAIEVSDEGLRLYTHIKEGLVVISELDDAEGSLIRRDWSTFMDEEFHAEAARHERTGRNLLQRKAIMQKQLEVRNQMGHLAKEQEEMTRQGIAGPVDAEFVPLAVGVAGQAYDQIHSPQKNVLSLFTGVDWPLQDLTHVSNGTSPHITQHTKPTTKSPSRLAAGVSDHRGSQPAFAHQFEMISSPTPPMHRAGTRRNDSFGGSSNSSGQGFQAGIRPGNYQTPSSRRSTLGRQGTVGGYSSLRRWSSNSPTKQSFNARMSQSQWQNAPYNGEIVSQAGHSRQPSQGRTEVLNYKHFDTLEKGKAHETSSFKYRGRSPAMGHERQELYSPSKRNSNYAPEAIVQDTSNISAADHSHPTLSTSVSSRIENADMLAAWGNRHNPEASHRARSEDSDVPSFKLDDSSPLDGTNLSLDNTCATTSKTSALPPHLQGKDSALVLALEEEGVKPTSTAKVAEEQNSQYTKGEPELQEKTDHGTESANASRKPTSEKPNVAMAKPSADMPSPKPSGVSDAQNTDALMRTKSNEWQVAQSKHKRAVPSKQPLKCNNKSSKEKRPRSEESMDKRKKKSNLNEPRVEREVSTGGDKKKKVTSSDPGKERETSGAGDKKSMKPGNGSGSASRAQGKTKSPKLDIHEGDKSDRPMKKSKAKDATVDYTAAFPSLGSPAVESSQKAAEKVKSWSAALQSSDLRVAAERYRLAAQTVLPMSPDAVFVKKKTSVSEALVREPFIPISNALTYASAAASGVPETGYSLTSKQKTPGPKAKASSGELRATATPFTPPAAGLSLLVSSPQGSFAAPLIPTYAQRAAAASVREEEAAALKVRELEETQKASAKLAVENIGATSVLRAAKNARSTLSLGESATHAKQKTKGPRKLSLSDHNTSKSVPTSIDGSVSSPTHVSVHSLPSTPMVPTYAQRAASASFLAIASVATPKNEDSVRSENIATPKPAKGPRPVPSTPAPVAFEFSLNTDQPSTLSTTARSFSYASKLAAPIPPVLGPSIDGLPKDEQRPHSQSTKSKPAGGTATSASFGKAEKKGSKDKVRDSSSGSFPTMAASRTIPATPVVPTWALKTRTRQDSGSFIDRSTILRLTSKQSKKPKSALANGPPLTIDASAMTATSSDSARASFASTATTSASSATLVSSETISSESASSASMRANSDVGPPSPVYRSKAPYQPARPMSEDGYKAPPPTLSPLETWAHKAGQKYVMAPPMGLHDRMELQRESRLTTPTGVRGAAGVKGEEHWRAGKPSQAERAGESSYKEADKCSWSTTVSDRAQEAEPWRALSEASESGSFEGEDDFHAGRTGRSRKGEVPDPAQGSRSSRAVDEENPTLGKTRSQTRRNRDIEQSSTTEGGEVISPAGKSESEIEGSQGHHQEQQKEKGQVKNTPRSSSTSPDRGSGAGAGAEDDGDERASRGVGQQAKVAVEVSRETKTDDSGVGEAGKMRLGASSSVDGNGTQSTAEGRTKAYMSKAERQKERKTAKNRLEQLKGKAGEGAVALAEAKVETTKLGSGEAGETPKKISWADVGDDDDEWAGFETLAKTTPEAKMGSERMGG